MKVYELETCRGLEKFYTIDNAFCGGVEYLLLESCKYSEEVPFIIIRKDNGLVVEWNWYCSLLEWFDC